MKLFGYELTRRPAAPPPLRPIATRGGGGWYPIVREPFTGAWQLNAEISAENVLSNPYVFACVRLIANDIGKLRLRLVEEDGDGIWHEADSPAFSPVLRKPNDYQSTHKFLEQWIISKLTTGNAYVLKARDGRGVVTALYVLDPAGVTPLVTADGAVYYELRQDDLAGIHEASRIVPAREIIHDPYLCLFHRLIGVSPLYAAALAAMQGIQIQGQSSRFFSKGATPSGVLSTAGHISDEAALELKTRWDSTYGGSGAGGTAVLGDGLAFEKVTMSAVDSQLVDQLKWTGDTICTAFGVPISMIDETRMPSGDTNESRVQHYYSECLQPLVNAIEVCLDEGLELLDAGYGSELDIDDLIWMDTATKTKAAADTIGAGALSPNEARRKYFGLGPVKGGDSPMVQQQYFSLQALAERDRDQPFAKTTPATPAIPATTPTGADAEDADEPADTIKAIHPLTFRRALLLKTAEIGL